MSRIRFGWLATVAGWRRLVDAASTAGAVAYVLLALGVSGFSAAKLPYWWVGLIILAGFYAVVFAEGAYRIWSFAAALVVAEQAKPRPHLVFSGVDNAQASIMVRAWEPSGTTVMLSHGASEPHDFVRVNVANDPPEGVAGVKAEKVVARIAFKADDGHQPVKDMLGRWAETPQRAETGRMGLSFDEAQLDLDPNGLPHPLDIAMKRRGDASCFAFNSENSTVPDLKLPQHELTEASYLVRVSIRGSNTETVVADFVLMNNPGVQLQLRGPYDPQDVEFL